MIKIKKILRKTVLGILILLVSIIVFFAIGSNIHKFESKDVVKYSQIRIEEPSNLEDIINNYSSSENRDKFITEFKKVNSIDSCQYISNKTLIIPIFKSN